jgi:hypothetical protein
MTHEESAELTEPCVGSFDDPVALISSQFSSVLVAVILAGLAVLHDEVDTVLCEQFAQRVGGVGAVGDYAFWLSPRTAFGVRNIDFGERGLRKPNFSRRGTFEPNSQRKTAAIDQDRLLRSLAALGFINCGTPYFAGAKLPSRNVSSHCFNRRQQVAGEGYLSGKDRHASPVCSTQKMPSRQARLDAHGPPPLSLRSFGSGNRGAIDSQCAPLNNSNRFLLMQKANQTTASCRNLQLGAEPIYETRASGKVPLLTIDCAKSHSFAAGSASTNLNWARTVRFQTPVGNQRARYTR